MNAGATASAMATATGNPLSSSEPLGAGDRPGLAFAGGDPCSMVRLVRPGSSGYAFQSSSGDGLGADSCADDVPGPASSTRPMTNQIVRPLTCRLPAYKCPSPGEKRPGSGNAHFRKAIRENLA